MPSNTLIGALRVEATLDAGKFVDGAKKIQLSSKQTESAVKSSFSSLGRSIKAGIAGFVGAVTIGSIVAAGKAALDYAGHLGELADTLGLTTKDLQTFSFAAGQVGISQDELQTGIQKLTISMGQAQLGAEKQTKAFNAVGISIDSLKGKTAGDVFRILADRLSDVSDRSQRAAVEVALFGKSGAKLDNLLSGAQGRLSELSDAAERLGIVLSDEQIEKADRTADKLEALKTVLSANIAGAVADNADSIYRLANSIANLVSQIPRAINQIRAFYHEAAAFSARTSGGVSGLLNSVPSGVVDAAGTMFPLARLLNVGRGNRANNMRAQGLTAQEEDWQAFLARNGFGNPTGSPPPRSRLPSSDIPKFLAPKAPKAPKAKDRNEDTEFQLQQELMQTDMDILRAKQQLAGSSEDRAKLDLQVIDLEHAMQAADIDHRVAQAQRQFADKQITKATLDQVIAQAAVLRSKNDEKTAIEKRALVEERLTRAEQAQFEGADQQRKFQIDALQAADQLATTAADHRRIQLQILDAEIEQKRLELEHEKQLAIRNGATADEIKVIQDKIDHLGTERAQGAAQINANTRNPLEEWAAGVPQTTNEIIDSFQKIESQGLDSLTDAMTDVITGTRSLKDAFGQLANQIVADIVRMIVKMMLFRALSSVMGLGMNFSLSGGLVGSGTSPFAGPINSASFGSANFGLGGGLIGSGASPFAGSIPAFATGGSFTIMGRSGTDKNVLALNGLPIARVSNMERVSISNDNSMGAGMPPPVHIVTNIDATGADPAELSRVRSAVAQLNAELPYRVVQAWYDAASRNVIR
jgi:hypothetical protein